MLFLLAKIRIENNKLELPRHCFGVVYMSDQSNYVPAAFMRIYLTKRNYGGVSLMTEQENQ